MRRLRQNKVDERSRDDLNRTKLIRKSKEGSHLEVERLLREGADVHAVDVFQCTALHYAARNGHVLIVKALVYAGSDVNAVDDHQRTPLDCTRLTESYSGPRMEIQQFLRHQLQENAPRKRQRSCLRHRASEHEYLWIDAICINQDDDQEKSTQVAMIGEIYKQAAHVAVWLGPTYQKWDDPALSFLQGVWTLEGVRTDGNIGDGVMEKMLALFDKSNPYEVCTDESSPASLAVRDWINSFDGNSLFDGWLLGPSFFQRTWFTRVWILQELFMAKDISMVCGQYIVPLDILIFVTSFIEGMRSSFRYKRSERKRIMGALVVCGQSEQVPPLKLERSKRIYKVAKELPMLNALQLTRNAQCKDPRDKVFSALSFSFMERSTKAGMMPFHPDYTRPVEGLYTDIGRALLEKYGPAALSFTGMRESSDRCNDFPSWVPDLRIPLVAPPSGIDVDSISSSTIQDTGALVDTATGRLYTSFLRIGPDNVLEVAGVIWDTIAEVTASESQDSNDQLDRIVRWTDFIQETDHVEVPKHRALWHTLAERQPSNTHSLKDENFRDWLIILGCTSILGLRDHLQASLENRIVPDIRDIATNNLTSKPGRIESTTSKVKSLFANLDISVKENDKVPRPVQRCFSGGPPLVLRPPSDELSHSDNVPYDLVDVWEDIAPFAEIFGREIQDKDPARRLMRTTNARVLGTVPAMAKVGDMICAIYGARVPYILRRNSNGKFLLIGEAFVYRTPVQHALLDAMLEGRMEKIHIV